MARIIGRPMVLYLLHIEPPYKHAGHYLGITRADRIAERLAEHGRGQGSSLTAAALHAGCSLRLVRLWQGASYEEERRRKHAGHLPLYCPVCAGSLPDVECWSYPPVSAASKCVPKFHAIAWPQLPPTPASAKQPP